MPSQKQTKAHSAQLEANAAQANGAKPQTVKPAVEMDVIQQLSAKIEALTKLVDSLRQPAQVRLPEQACQCFQKKPTTTVREKTERLSFLVGTGPVKLLPLLRPW